MRHFLMKIMEVSYNNRPVHFEISGAGKAIVLLHGFLENSQIWEPAAAVLAKNFLCIKIDLFGHGKTPQQGEQHKMSEMAKAVNAVLEKLNVTEAAFLGHSMGGYVALAFAELFPEKVHRLLLLNSTAYADSEARKKVRERAMRLVKQNKEAFVSMAIKNLFSEVNKNKFSQQIEAMVLEAKKLSVEAVVATLSGLKERKNRVGVLADFAKKTYLLGGEEDPLVLRSSQEQLAEETGVPLVLFEGGHMSYLEAQEAFLTKVQFILDK